MKGKAWLFSALSATEDLPAGAEGAKAAADPARRAREVTFIMVKTFVGERVKAEKRGWKKTWFPANEVEVKSLVGIYLVSRMIKIYCGAGNV